MENISVASMRSKKILRHDNAVEPAGFDTLLGFAEQTLITRDWSRLAVPAGLQLVGKIELMRRSGHRFLFVRGVGQPYVLKCFADFGDERPGRRIEFWLKTLFKNPASKSYLGARRIQQLGLPVIEPIACLTISSLFTRRAIFIYREAESDQTFRQWLDTQPTDHRRTDAYLQLAGMIDVMRRARLIQPDLVYSNVLVREDGDRLEMTLIDTDDVTRMSSALPDFAARFVFVWSLRRMRVPEALREQVFDTCMGGGSNPYWMRYWLFLQNTNFKPWKQWSRRLRKRYTPRSGSGR